MPDLLRCLVLSGNSGVMKEKPKIIHLGGEHTVTGSCHLLQANGIHIMVDCGLAQGNDVLLPMKSWPVSPSEVDYLFLTHVYKGRV